MLAAFPLLASNASVALFGAYSLVDLVLTSTTPFLCRWARQTTAGPILKAPTGNRGAEDRVREERALQDTLTTRSTLPSQRVWKASVSTTSSIRAGASLFCLLLVFMTIHLFQFRFAGTARFDFNIQLGRGLVAMTPPERLLVHVEEHGANGWSDCVPCCGSHSGNVLRDMCRGSPLHGCCVLVGVFFRELFRQAEHAAACSLSTERVEQIFTSQVCAMDQFDLFNEFIFGGHHELFGFAH